MVYDLDNNLNTISYELNEQEDKQMADEQIQIDDWREGISGPKQTLKIADGQNVNFTFKDGGVKKTHPDFGVSVAFTVKVDGEDEEKNFYVSASNYDLLGQIKDLGNLENLKANVSRKGSKRSDTRYIIKKL